MVGDQTVVYIERLDHVQLISFRTPGRVLPNQRPAIGKERRPMPFREVLSDYLEGPRSVVRFLLFLAKNARLFFLKDEDGGALQNGIFRVELHQTR